MRISDWSSDVCSSDLYGVSSVEELLAAIEPITRSGRGRGSGRPVLLVNGRRISGFGAVRNIPPEAIAKVEVFPEEVALQYGYAATERVVNIVLKPSFRQISAEAEAGVRSEEHTSELQSLMRISYAVFCLKKKKISKRLKRTIHKA